MALNKFKTLAVPVIIGVARWVTFIGDFRDDLLRRLMGDRSNRWRTVIGTINPIVSWALEKSVPLGFHCMVARMENGACNLLVIQTILEVDWYGTFGWKPVMNTGRYFYFDYHTERVDFVPSWTRSEAGVSLGLVPNVHPGRRTMLADCNVEVRRYDSKHSRHFQEALEARTRWEAA